MAKWAGLGVCCLILTVWGLTVDFVGGPRLEVTYHGSLSTTTLKHGGVVWWDVRRVDAPHRLSFDRLPAVEWPWRQRFGLDLPDTGSLTPVGGRFVYSPLWPFLCLLGVPTVVLFWRDRRPKPGHCRKCGYNLTGNVSGVCSECGEATTRPGEDKA